MGWLAGTLHNHEQSHVRANYATLCAEVAQRIAQLIRRKPNAVLGLATGSTPVGVYAELARLHREEGLDFAQVTTFNLDEYYPMSRDAPQSYHRFMREQLFDHINCENYHIPDGTPRDLDQVHQDCAHYEEMIAAAGGLDLQLLGIGRTGHIGFNEPGSPRDSRTRLGDARSHHAHRRGAGLLRHRKRAGARHYHGHRHDSGGARDRLHGLRHTQSRYCAAGAGRQDHLQSARPRFCASTTMRTSIWTTRRLAA